MMVLIENLGNRGSLAEAQTPILDRLAELGRTGHVTTGWKALPSLEFVWKIASRDPFPGLGPLEALSRGLNAFGKTVALADFVKINKSMEILEDLKAPQDMKIRVGSFEFELKTLKGQSFVIYKGSENVAGNTIKDGAVNKVAPVEAGAKATSKALRTFSDILNEKTGRYPILKGFGKIKKTPLKVNACMSCDSQKFNGLIKILGMKKVKDFACVNKALGPAGPHKKIAVFGEKTKSGLEKVDKLLLPLIALSEKETVIVCGTTTENTGLDQPMLIAGPKFTPDNVRIFDGSHNGARYSLGDLAEMLSKL